MISAVTIIAWLGALAGGFLVCALLTAEFFGKQTLPGWPIKTHWWGRFAILFLVCVCWLLGRDI